MFGKDYDGTLYKEIVSAVGLDQDIATFAGGDLYNAGPDGIHLSGGQKQRVSLARALYQDADIYLLDDVLSAGNKRCLC